MSNALVTGAAGGIGYELARQLAARGTAVFARPAQAARFEQLKADVQKGIDQLDAGQGRELTDEVFEEIKARGRAELARRSD